MDSFLNISRGGNTSIQWGQYNVLGESDHHLLQAHGSVLPVLLIEAISSEVSPFQSISVNIVKEGWAWLVCGRRLFVWKYVQTKKSRIESFELQLPGSDLLHKADLVCLVSYKSTHVPGIVAVSPEGTIRYWPSIAHDGHFIETVAGDLQGQECFSLTDIEPLGYILGTTTSSLSHIYITSSSIVCRTLKIPQGVLAGFGQRVTSFIFGALPSSNSNENKPLTKIIREKSSSDEAVIFVLAGTYLQKWSLVDFQTEKLICEYDLEKAITDSYLSTVWNPGKTHPNQLKMWFIDMELQENLILILVAALNQDVSHKLYYAIAVIDVMNISSNQENLKITKFTVLRSHTPNYSSNNEANLLSLKMITNVESSDVIYIYDKTRIFCCQYNNDVIDLISFTNRESQILGAGVFEGNPLLFTSRDNLVAVKPKDNINQLIETYKATPSIIKAPKMSGNPIENLRSAFRMYRRKETRECSAYIAAFLANFDKPSSESGSDEFILKLSQELCDESPSTDPRWLDNLNLRANREAMSALILKQLEEKLDVHRQFLDFLKVVRIWSQLSLVNYNGCVSPTKLILCEHEEKIVMAIAIKNLHQELDDIFEPAIDRLIDLRREESEESHLSANDRFYRQVTKIHEILPVLIQFEEEELLACMNSPKDGLKLVLTISDIVINVFHEVRRFKASNPELYDNLAAKNIEYVPLTATVGPNGIRTSLLKQLDVLIKNSTRTDAVLAGQDDETQLKGIIYQKIVDISDIILEGYVNHLKTIDETSERFKLINKSFDADRTQCIKPLLQAKQYERACSLAEKYHDFETLVRSCEELDNKTKLNRYVEEFKEKGFSEFLFKWYMKEGKQGKMLTTRSQDLSNFLKDHDDINWLHYIGMDKFNDAANSLQILAAKTDENINKKKTLLSLSKLCLLTNGDQDQDQIEDINKQLEEILVETELSEQTDEDNFDE